MCSLHLKKRENVKKQSKNTLKNKYEFDLSGLCFPSSFNRIFSSLFWTATKGIDVWHEKWVSLWFGESWFGIRWHLLLFRHWISWINYSVKKHVSIFCSLITWACQDEALWRFVALSLRVSFSKALNCNCTHDEGGSSKGTDGSFVFRPLFWALVPCWGKETRRFE